MFLFDLAIVFDMLSAMHAFYRDYVARLVDL